MYWDMNRDTRTELTFPLTLALYHFIFGDAFRMICSSAFRSVLLESAENCQDLDTDRILRLNIGYAQLVND